mmetsp:Transcript_48506/g.135567  ORF Transcript_48506/g.135567 Transcript_48506/m.135567 type:complete len:246 (+) Transcript_48506:163-900(+)
MLTLDEPSLPASTSGRAAAVAMGAATIRGATTTGPWPLRTAGLSALVACGLGHGISARDRGTPWPSLFDAGTLGQSFSRSSASIRACSAWFSSLSVATCASNVRYRTIHEVLSSSNSSILASRSVMASARQSFSCITRLRYCSTLPLCSACKTSNSARSAHAATSSRRMSAHSAAFSWYLCSAAASCAVSTSTWCSSSRTRAANAWQLPSPDVVPPQTTADASPLARPASWAWRVSSSTAHFRPP